ncbi:AMP deaminase [Pneumocystis carinii B80]|uniref:AMP deaminase n=1 Tax=Pneumocystis carinii (strain B80) TaxID=1408658 RepID=A0A0W4ZLU5_PNEC8|nr:AMP deaminase [Pneumocystis carinii B80]KTW29345.1 AMP deaminase [Pneumocystis carinii B80]
MKMDQRNNEYNRYLLNSYEEARFFNDFCCIDSLIYEGLFYGKEAKDQENNNCPVFFKKSNSSKNQVLKKICENSSYKKEFEPDLCLKEAQERANRCLYFQEYYTLYKEAQDLYEDITVCKTDLESMGKLKNICSSLYKCLILRNQYIKFSLQRHIDNPRHEKVWDIYPKDNEEFEIEKCLIPGEDNQIKYRYESSGIFQTYSSQNDMDIGNSLLNVATISEFYENFKEICDVINDESIKEFSSKRLKYLEDKWEEYITSHEKDEIIRIKQIPLKDFYNIRKVDTHIHHDASATKKHLLGFIKRKLRDSPNDIVLYQDGKYHTLKDIFDSFNLTEYDLTIDTLDMHAYKDTFQHFEVFNSRFSPFGKPIFRTIFLSTDNYMKGKYFAELTHELINKLEDDKYKMAEYRLTIFGISLDEWDKLASWVIDNNLFSLNVRWIIQVPRIYNIFKKNGTLNNMEELIKNFFQPLFEITFDPSKNPKLHIFLQRVVGFDSVDDESKPEIEVDCKFLTPTWDYPENPPYLYWHYYTYMNMAVLNHWRKERGFNTFLFRPHSGEAGNISHLACSFLTSYSINHGILLEKNYTIQYLYYLAQIGISMSPISNNLLFLRFHENPFPLFFKRGLNVTLSTDDPVQFHFTEDPLLEEYAVASQIWSLSAVDMCELARTSVLQSGFEYKLKMEWFGDEFQDENKTNVPKIRLDFRKKTYFYELFILIRNIAFDSEN